MMTASVVAVEKNVNRVPASPIRRGSGLMLLGNSPIQSEPAGSVVVDWPTDGLNERPHCVWTCRPTET